MSDEAQETATTKVELSEGLKEQKEFGPPKRADQTGLVRRALRLLVEAYGKPFEKNSGFRLL